MFKRLISLYILLFFSFLYNEYVFADYNTYYTKYENNYKDKTNSEKINIINEQLGKIEKLSPEENTQKVQDLKSFLIQYKEELSKNNDVNSFFGTDTGNAISKNNSGTGNAVSNVQQTKTADSTTAPPTWLYILFVVLFAVLGTYGYLNKNPKKKETIKEFLSKFTIKDKEDTEEVLITENDTPPIEEEIHDLESDLPEEVIDSVPAQENTDSAVENEILELRNEILSLHTENESLRKDIEQLKSSSDELKTKMLVYIRKVLEEQGNILSNINRQASETFIVGTETLSLLKNMGNVPIGNDTHEGHIDIEVTYEQPVISDSAEYVEGTYDVIDSPAEENHDKGDSLSIIEISTEDAVSHIIEDSVTNVDSTDIIETDTDEYPYEKEYEILSKTNDNLFITGKAGVGKSTFLRKFLKGNSERNIVVLAPTGTAAINIDGQTIHRFFEIHKGKAMSKENAEVLRKTEIIVIDEISMVRADLLDQINEKMQDIIGNGSPFGGVRMIFVGDLFQLPPVVLKEEKETFNGGMYESPFFFSAKSYEKGAFRMIELTHVFRQKDERFVSVLNNIRVGEYTDNDLKILNEQYGKLGDDASIYLTADNATADQINETRINQIETKSVNISAYIGGKFPKDAYPTAYDLELKEGCRVICVKNDKELRWSNGSMGTIEAISDIAITIRFDNGNTYDVQRETWDAKKVVYNNGKFEHKVLGTFTQFPIKLGYSMTAHKCLESNQYISTKYGNVKIKDINIGDYVYSGFSMRKVLDKVYCGVKPVYCIRTKTGRELLSTLEHRFYSTYMGDISFRTLGEIQNLKDVKVAISRYSKDEIFDENLFYDSIESINYVGEKECFDLEVEGDHSFVAEGIVVHNSQGKTFDNVVIDTGRGMFAHGQCYVALSRCTTLEGMKLKNKILPKDIIVDERVIDFMKNKK